MIEYAEHSQFGFLLLYFRWSKNRSSDWVKLIHNKALEVLIYFKPGLRALHKGYFVTKYKKMNNIVN